MDYSVEWFKKGQICGRKFADWKFIQQVQVRDPQRKEEIFQLFRGLRIKVQGGWFKKHELDLFQAELDSIEEKIGEAIRLP